MGLVDMQRELIALCFRAEPAQAASLQPFAIYREMVRERMLRQIRVALPRTCALVGAAGVEAAFAWHLEQQPPRTRFFRELIGVFVASALPLWAADKQLHPACCELARYELALWELADLEPPELEPYGDFSFEGRPVVCPVLRLLTVSHTVHEPGLPLPGTCQLCVFRVADAELAQVYKLTPATHALLVGLVQGDRSVSGLVRQLTAASGVALDQAYVDALCETLAQFLELGIVLGSR